MMAQIKSKCKTILTGAETLSPFKPLDSSFQSTLGSDSLWRGVMSDAARAPCLSGEFKGHNHLILSTMRNSGKGRDSNCVVPLITDAKSPGACSCWECVLSRVWLFAIPRTVAQLPLCPWDFPGKNTGVACHFLLRELSWHRDQTGVFCISCMGRWAFSFFKPLSHLGGNSNLAGGFGIRVTVRKGNWRYLVSESENFSVVSNSLQPHGLYSPWNSPGQNTGIGSLSLLPGIFPTHGLNPGLLHCRQILYQLSHKGSPRIMEWVAYPSPTDLPNPGINLGSPAWQAYYLPTELSRKPIFCMGAFKMIHALLWLLLNF